ncbi:MAG: DUF4160 domain-containing protein [Chloroflexota bacterium]
MPTALRIKGYAFFFRAGDCPERPHAHVRGIGGTAKVWLEPMNLAYSTYNAARTAEVLAIADRHQSLLLGRWVLFCGS